MIQGLKEIVISALEDLKAHNINQVETSNQTLITDYMIIANGSSTRHIQTIANYIAKKLEPIISIPISIEGNRNSDWVLVDLGDLILHIMLPQSREYYALDKLWSPLNPSLQKVS